MTRAYNVIDADSHILEPLDPLACRIWTISCPGVAADALHRSALNTNPSVLLMDESTGPWHP